MDFDKAPVKQPRPYKSYRLDPEPKEWDVLSKINWDKEIHVEVGCGKGHWILSEAPKHKDRVYIGIERTQNKSHSFVSGASDLDTNNLYAIRADAVILLDQKFLNESIDALYFFYPNPTPKLSQCNQRFLVGSAFEVFDHKLKAGGTIQLTTNIKAYWEEVLEFLEKIWGYEILRAEELKTPFKGRTAFESKYLERNESLYEVVGCKKPG